MVLQQTADRDGRAANERELLSGFRLRTAGVARNAAWITLAGIAALTIPHHSFTGLNSHTSVWVLLAVAALGNLFTYTPVFNRLVQGARSGWPFCVWTVLLLFFDGTVVGLSQDGQHQVYLIYIPVLLFAVATLEPWAYAAALLLAVGTALAALALSDALSTDAVVASSTTFVVVWLLGAYLSREERHEILERARHESEAVERGRELAVLHERAVALAAQLRTTVAKVIRAQEEERRRIGRELHDGAVQSLSAATLRIGDLAEQAPPRPGHPREELLAARTLLTDTLREIRKIIVDLRPSGLDELGLVPAVRAYAHSHLEEAGIALEMRVQGPVGRLPPEVETAVFRIAQEAVNNVVRHAAARHAAVALAQRDGIVVLEVEDDGAGFDPESLGTDGGGGLGLLGMRERAALLGGTLHVASTPGAGTRVQATIPLSGGRPS